MSTEVWYEKGFLLTISRNSAVGEDDLENIVCIHKNNVCMRSCMNITLKSVQ